MAFKLDWNSSTDRLQILLLATLFNGVLGVAFLLSTFFVSGVWGFSAWFQALTTAAAHLALTVAFNSWLKAPNTDHVDLLGAFLVAMVGMLLQTAVLWGGLGGNIAQPAQGGQAEPCVVFGGAGDRATSAFGWILFVTNVGFGAAAYTWRNDYLRGQSGLGGYSSIPTSSAPLTHALNSSTGGGGGVRIGGGGGGGGAGAAGGRLQGDKDGFLDDAEGNL